MKWRCKLCHLEVEADTEPNPRYEAVRTLPVPNERNSFVGVDNQDYKASACHSGPVCFGPERGEDYYRHDWRAAGRGTEGGGK